MIINSPKNVYEATSKYRAKRQEHFIVITLDGANQIIKIHTVTVGLVNRTIVHPREIFYRAIKDLSTSIMLVHNHPSGFTNPSQEDIDITQRLKKAGEIIGIPVVDHIIISKRGYTSFVEMSLL